MGSGRQRKSLGNGHILGLVCWLGEDTIEKLSCTHSFNILRIALSCNDEAMGTKVRRCTITSAATEAGHEIRTTLLKGSAVYSSKGQTEITYGDDGIEASAILRIDDDVAREPRCSTPWIIVPFHHYIHAIDIGVRSLPVYDTRRAQFLSVRECHAVVAVMACAEIVRESDVDIQSTARDFFSV